MKSNYLIQVMSNLDVSLVETLLIVREKFKYNNSIRYILGDITADIDLITDVDVEVGDIVNTSIRNNIIEQISIYYGEYDLRDFMPFVKKDIKSILNELESLTTEKFKTREAIELNNYFFKDNEFLNEFSNGIGGLGHHVYMGGLAEHTLNVVYWTSKLINKYQCRHKEIALLSAKLHDIGKIYEYNYRGKFKATLRGEMEGHIVIGITMIDEALKKNPNLYSEEFINRIKGCIVQHHGDVQYGSPKSPNTEEAFIVHYADYIDATMSKISKIEYETQTNTWSIYSDDIKRRIFN